MTKARGKTSMRHIHLTPELYAKLWENARSWKWKSTSAYVEHEMRRILNMDTAGYERKPMPEFCIEAIEGRHCIFVRRQGIRYVFRYAQNSASAALEVMERLSAHFGEPAGIETDLAANYWRSPIGLKLKFMQRTTQKDSWYIDDPSAVTP